jgi:hypothetical protein
VEQVLPFMYMHSFVIYPWAISINILFLEWDICYLWNMMYTRVVCVLLCWFGFFFKVNELKLIELLLLDNFTTMFGWIHNNFPRRTFSPIFIYFCCCSMCTKDLFSVEFHASSKMPQVFMHYLWCCTHSKLHVISTMLDGCNIAIEVMNWSIVNIYVVGIALIFYFCVVGH